MTIRNNVAFALVAAVALSACGKPQQTSDASTQTGIDMEQVRRDFETVASARILLGHQSVGRDVIAGLKSLAAESRTALRVVEIDGVPPDDGPGLFSNHIGNNGDPGSKCEAFGQLLLHPERPQYDVAMMKFCYADLREGTPMSADEMLDRYERLTRSIREQRPDVRLVHVTMPLKAEPIGKKTWLKRKLGMSVDGDDANVHRNKFNEGLRARYGKEPMLDLATLESTLPDGTRSSFERDGKTVYQLAGHYTHDGGHLNEIGKRRAAIAFVRTLAAALSSTAS